MQQKMLEEQQKKHADPKAAAAALKASYDRKKGASIIVATPYHVVLRILSNLLWFIVFWTVPDWLTDDLLNDWLIDWMTFFAGGHEHDQHDEETLKRHMEDIDREQMENAKVCMSMC